MLEFDYHGVNVRVQDDSYYPLYGGGSKARKLASILSDAQQQQTDAVITAGAANSNHARATALACAELGWKCIIVVHDVEDYQKGNLLLMRLAGAELVFVEHSAVAETMDQQIERLRMGGYRPYYIYGGGHSVFGSLAFYKAVTEVANVSGDWIPDNVVHACGTGGIQAGLVVGCSNVWPDSRVLGVSIARKASRGKQVVATSVKELTSHLEQPELAIDRVIFRDDWIGGGYGSTYPKLMETIRKAASEYGLVTDPTYTGKALLGMFDMIESGEIEEGSRVLFWHTGGIVNLFQYARELS